MIASRARLAAIAAGCCAVVAGTVQRPAPAGQARPERLWLAGRYDDHHVVVYFGTSHFHDDVPRLLNAIDLGDGRVAMIADFLGTDGRSLSLYEYRDGATLAQMRLLQVIEASE